MNRKSMWALALALVGLPLVAVIWLSFGGARAAAPATPAAATPPPEGPRLTAQSFGSWVYRCQEAMGDGKPAKSACELAQEVSVQQNGKAEPVMTIAFSQGDNGGHNVTLRVPLGVRLKPGVGLMADDGSPLALAFDYCGPRGCWIAPIPADGLIAGLKTGKTGRAKLTMLNGQDVTIEFPLAGFAGGLAALDASPADTKPAKAKPKRDNP